MSVAARLATAHAPGAVAVIELVGDADDIVDTLNTLTGRCEAWPVGAVRHRDLAGIDDGVVVRVAERLAHVMPHGGPRIVQRLLGVIDSTRNVTTTPATRYPEAGSGLEARVLEAIARATSPAAIDLLLQQPALWGETDPSTLRGAERDAVARRSVQLDRILTPISVVVVGEPNAGKSTLTNAVLARDASLVSGTPGTTRDAVAGDTLLPTPLGDVAARWLDTPGLRETVDPAEAAAIALAADALRGADVLIALRAPGGAWPVLPREPDVLAQSHADEAPCTEAEVVSVSGVTGAGLPALFAAIAAHLGLSPTADDRWVFDAEWREALRSSRG